MNRRGAIATGAAAVFAPLLGAGPLLAKSAQPQVGQTAPDFHAVTFAGEKVSLADYKDRVLILNFWATWCGPCRTELPLLDVYYGIQREFGLDVLGVTLEEQVPVSRLAPLASKVAFKMARRFTGPYGRTGQMPTNYVVDRAGVLRYGQPGAFNLEYLNDLIVPMLNEPPPDAGPQTS